MQTLDKHTRLIALLAQLARHTFRANQCRHITDDITLPFQKNRSIFDNQVIINDESWMLITEKAGPTSLGETEAKTYIRVTSS